ncbi:MAG: DUF4389 domain-containing protein [Candidatus Binatia bacterium]
MQVDEIQLERKETAIRILISLLFWVILEVVKAVLGALILFELAFALITKRPPSDRVRQFANRALSYHYRILRYLTYNEPDWPFPFSEFPPQVEPSAQTPQRREERPEDAEGKADE